MLYTCYIALLSYLTWCLTSFLVYCILSSLKSATYLIFLYDSLYHEPPLCNLTRHLLHQMRTHLLRPLHSFITYLQSTLWDFSLNSQCIVSIFRFLLSYTAGCNSLKYHDKPKLIWIYSIYYVYILESLAARDNISLEPNNVLLCLQTCTLFFTPVETSVDIHS